MGLGADWQHHLKNMAYEQKPNTGSLFRNDKKESDSHPSHKGNAIIAGVDYWMDAWVNETNDGRKYFSLKFKPKESKPKQAAAPSTTNDGDDIPF